MKNHLKKFQKIAVVGMEGVFPQAANKDQFLNNIINKKNAIIPVPENRWLHPVKNFLSTTSEPDKAVSNMAGFIEDFDFDPSGFLLDNTFLSGLDPVHQLVLHASKRAFEQCSHTAALKKRTGVILSAIALPTRTSSLFSKQVMFGDDINQFDAQTISRTGVVAYPASILARAMGFEAGSFTLDAACASSLFSIKLACEHLSLKKADIMIAGGVSKPSSLYTQIGFTQLQALSPTGTCSPFDAGANGLVVGEGTGIIVLKRLEDAIACKDKIYAVITGAGVSNDIEGTLVGPASEGQIRAMIQAYKSASWSVEDIQYMECHGSGTPVGDQVELSSIKTLLNEFSCPDKKLSIGSVKSMIGHLLTAAGAAGFMKTVLSMNEGFLPPSLNFNSPAAKSPLHTSRIQVQTMVDEWKPEKRGATKKAAVSAFGFGGINAHLLIEEYKAESKIHPVGQLEPGAVNQTVDCAIVGMEAIIKDCPGLEKFKDHVLNQFEIKTDHAEKRWKRNHPDGFNVKQGCYLDQIDVIPGQFHIPPNQMADILPQHLVLLKSVYGALKDAGIPPRPAAGELSRSYIGCAIGIDFDYGATDFHLRWQVNDLDETVKNQISPSLTFNRTLGALGGIVASRVAREFQFGGPCFTVSACEITGFKAIETAIHSLSRLETDLFICGCVDLLGDIRSTVLNQLNQSFYKDLIPTEGSAAIVLKRHDQAIKDGDKIYAVIKGTGFSSGGVIPGEIDSDPVKSKTKQEQSINIALNNADVSLSDITSHERCAFNSGTASSLFFIIKTALLFNKNNETDKQIVCVETPGTDGTFGHVIMERCQNNSLEEKFQKPDAPLFGEKNIIRLKTNPRPVSEETVKTVQRHLGINRLSFQEETHAPCRQESLPIDIKPIHVPSSKTGRLPLDPLLISQAGDATASAHEKFLEFSSQNMQQFEKQFAILTRLAGQPSHDPQADDEHSAPDEAPKPFLDRDMCLEYATGKAGTVLGEKFGIIDTYPVRVRLPAEPLMLVDRIMKIEGEMLSLGTGKIITQHDVKKDAWYLDGPKAPVSISIEAGQADLFLCAWLGIDHAVKGKRKYRLLDASVTFHRTLPEAGETIEYHIEIDRFLKQGDVYLFFFHYKGYINNRLLISMRDGCAGFFTEQEVENSGGIVLKKEDTQSVKTDYFYSPWVPVQRQSFNDHQVQMLRNGDLEAAFGPEFKGRTLGQHLLLPGGRMHLIDRVLDFNPSGGRFGLGKITAQLDIHPDDWFLTCHFIDDMVMPGTLMYDCCAHTLRVFTQRIGWISDRNDVFYDVLTNNESDLKCRGPVTRQTKHARYEIEIKAIGYNPEPYIIADAHMFSDDLQIVLYKDMGLKLSGLTENDLKIFWSTK